MARFSKVEFNNLGRGWIEEVALRSFVYEASLFGFIRRVTFMVGNNVNNTPVMISGTTTGGTATTLTDSAAEFTRLHLQPGDIVTNVTDTSTWEIVTVDSATQLTVQLVDGSGTWTSSEVYSIEARNPEDIYIPFSTEVRVTGRDISKLIFTGVVQEIIPEGEFDLKVIAVARDSELRDGAPQTDAAELAAHSHIIQDAIDDTDAAGQWLFPLISSFEGEPGLDHSPNLNQVKPDFSKNARNALPQFIDLAKSDNWCPDLLREPTLPTAASTFDTNDSESELAPDAQGSLAQSFQVATHHLLSKMGLRLKLIEGVGTVTGNVYIRIEANDLSGDSAGSGLDIPSGELLTPWAESNLVNIQNISDEASGDEVQFLFDRPVALRPDTRYWIVLQYQENNVTGYDAGVDYVSWRTDSAAGYANGYAADYGSNVWVTDNTIDRNFAVYEHTDAVWYYDVGTDAWTNNTTEALATDASTFSWMGAGSDDRVYIRTAGPIYGLDLVLVTTFASPEYGAFTVRYYGDNGAKVTGFHTGGSSTTVLTDANMDFRRTGVVVGDVIHHLTDDSYSVITAISQTTLTMSTLNGGTDDTWTTGDAYAVLNLELRDSGAATSGDNDTLNDTGADWGNDGVREGDLVVNVTDSQVAVVTAYSAFSIEATGGTLSFGASDEYKILSRWRTLVLKDTEPSFMAAGTVRLEWVIPADWVPTFIEAGNPEASSSGFTDVDDMRGFWISVQCDSIPAQRALVDEVVPLPGSGFVLTVTDQTHEDVVVAAGSVHDGGDDAASLTDTSVNFIADHGVLIGDIVENFTDGSRATITAITSTTAGLYNTLVGVLSGGADNDWDDDDKYRVLRARYRVRYSRNGARPYGLPANFGLTYRQGSGSFKQMKPLRDWSFSKSTRSSVNRVAVVGRSAAGAAVLGSANNLQAQRNFKRVISRTIVDYSLKTTTEASDRAATELSRLSGAAERGNVYVWSLPFFTRTRERQSWTNSGFGLASRLDDAGLSVYLHDTGASNAFLTDTSINFAKWNVEAGDLVTNVTDGSSAIVTSVSTTTNESDSVNGALTGGSDNDWDVGDEYRIEERTYVQPGDLIQVKVDDEDDYVDADYIVTGIRYSEPEFRCVLRISKNLTSPTVDDQQTQAEIDTKTRDVANAAAQRASYNDGA
jgi:hypothetical protein